MSYRPFDPWEEDGGIILRHPARPIRCWHIRRHDSRHFVGEVLGDPDPLDDGPRRTPAGTFYEVQRYLEAHSWRRGMPVFAFDARSFDEAVA